MHKNTEFDEYQNKTQTAISITIISELQDTPIGYHSYPTTCNSLQKAAKKKKLRLGSEKQKKEQRN